MFIDGRHALVTKAPEGRHVIAEYGRNFNARTQRRKERRAEEKKEGDA